MVYFWTAVPHHPTTHLAGLICCERPECILTPSPLIPSIAFVGRSGRSLESDWPAIYPQGFFTSPATRCLERERKGGAKIISAVVECKEQGKAASDLRATQLAQFDGRLLLRTKLLLYRQHTSLPENSQQLRRPDSSDYNSALSADQSARQVVVRVVLLRQCLDISVGRRALATTVQHRSSNNHKRRLQGR